jgi:hypothetical protein
MHQMAVTALLMALAGILGYLLGRRLEHRSIQRKLSPRDPRMETTVKVPAMGREVPVEGDEPKTSRKASDSDQYPATPAGQFPALNRNAETIKVERIEKRDTLP